MLNVDLILLLFLLLSFFSSFGKHDVERCSFIWSSFPLHLFFHLFLHLLFLVFSGRPLPQVHWVKDGLVIDDTYTTINDHSLGFVIENEILIKNLSRSDLNSVLSCEAINSNLTSRTSASVSLDLSCKWNSVLTASFTRMLFACSSHINPLLPSLETNFMRLPSFLRHLYFAYSWDARPQHKP